MGKAKALVDLRERQCRYPVHSDGRAHLFCAAPVAPWKPGEVNGCYCAAHRSLLAASGPSDLPADGAA